MDQQHQSYYFSKCHLCWDEQNRLVSFADCENAGFYQYDANGERTYKLTGGIAMQNIQGHWRSYNLLDNPTLYTSPYLVSTPKGYTKHYYAESERVASRIGGGGLGDITRTIMNMEDLLTDFWVGEDGLLWEEVWGSEFYETKLEGSRNHLTGVMMCAGADPLVEDNRLVELRTYWQYIQDEGEQECYWYHPDHLGSSSWITFSDGEAVQHLHYLPWGENFVDQRSSTFDGARFTFSAKEKDAETGYSYFGARYYSSDLSIWLSVDPMSDKYPSLSPYTYCANNPIKLVDPNGEEIGDYYDLNGKWLGRDRKNDNLAYTATSVVKDEAGYVISAQNKSLLPISNSELLDRATWVCGESGGSNEMITDRVQNIGDASKTLDASVAEYYAAAINNIANTSKGGFYEAIKIRMSRKGPDGNIIYTSSGYFTGQPDCGNSNSRAFAKARASGAELLNSQTRFTNSIAAVIKSVSGGSDPSNGCRAWLGGAKYAKPYVENANKRKTGATVQFSFQSQGGFHTFYRN